MNDDQRRMWEWLTGKNEAGNEYWIPKERRDNFRETFEKDVVFDGIDAGTFYMRCVFELSDQESYAYSYSELDREIQEIERIIRHQTRYMVLTEQVLNPGGYRWTLKSRVPCITSLGPSEKFEPKPRPSGLFIEPDVLDAIRFAATYRYSVIPHDPLGILRRGFGA